MEEHPYRDSIIRRASSSDIYALVNICRMAFPRNVRWQGFGSFARRWWEVAIMSSGAEALIIQVNDEVLALCVLVTDEAQWSQEKGQRRGPFVWRFISVMSCPVLAGSKIMRVMMDKIDSHQTQQPAVCDWKPKRRTWIELIAVCTQHRGRGLAKSLLQHCETRTIALGKKAISLRVHKSNKAARCLYKTMGYQETSVSGVDVIYSKLISYSAEPSFEKAPGRGL